MLRGLGANAYRVYDYVDNRELGVVQAPEARLDVEFVGALLIEAIPGRGDALAAVTHVNRTYPGKARNPTELSASASPYKLMTEQS